MRSFMPRCLSALLLLCLVAFASASSHTQQRRRIDRASTERSLVSDIEGQHLGKRVVSANICANVGLRVNIRVNAALTVNQQLGQTICLCAQGTALTPESAARLDTAIAANTVLAGLVGTGGLLSGLGTDTVYANVRALALGDTQNAGTTCTYPTSDPNFGAPTCPANSCTYTCLNGYKPCGTNSNAGCIAADAICPTTRTRRRSEIRACPGSLSLCAVPGTKRYSDAFECVDTQTDLESCGGCAFPLPGGRYGEDCTAMEGVAGVKCVSGACEAQSCIKGYALNGSVCEPVTALRFPAPLRVQVS